MKHISSGWTGLGSCKTAMFSDRSFGCSPCGGFNIYYNFTYLRLSNIMWNFGLAMFYHNIPTLCLDCDLAELNCITNVIVTTLTITLAITSHQKGMRGLKQANTGCSLQSSSYSLVHVGLHVGLSTSQPPQTPQALVTQEDICTPVQFGDRWPIHSHDTAICLRQRAHSSPLLVEFIFLCSSCGQSLHVFFPKLQEHSLCLSPERGPDQLQLLYSQCQK